MSLAFRGDAIECLRIQDFEWRHVLPGKKQRLRLSVLDGLSGDVSIPMVVARGSRPGRTLLAVAGVHGDEYEGMEAIRTVLADLDPCLMSGTFIGVIVANPFAYEARARVAPLHVDGLNLARVFPGESSGTPSKSLAHELLQLAVRNLQADDLLLDFHSGSADVAFATLIGYRDVSGTARQAAEEAGRHFGVPRLWLIPDSPGPFNAETSRRGIVTLGTETTGRAGLDPVGLAAFSDGLRNLLVYLGISASSRPLFRNPSPARRTVNVLAPATGFLRHSVGLLAEVWEHERLGQIVDLYGDPLATISSPAQGTIWATRSMPATRKGELLYMIALPVSE